MSNLNVISDNSFRDYAVVPEHVLRMDNLKMLYLDGNFIESLPDDFFQRLPKLYWLDLRGNRIGELPRGVGSHRYLENLLLQNNRIERLPNELGLVPNLKVLQLSGNPLTYPPQNIIEGGIDDICSYLKHEYYKHNDHIPSQETLSARSSCSTTENTLTEQSVSYDLSDAVIPTIGVASLSLIKDRLARVCPRLKKTHTITKKPSSLKVSSQFRLNEEQRSDWERRIEEEQVKEMWLQKLKEVIRDQERIIQQEKSLTALHSWRKKQRKSSPGVATLPPPPFATRSEYNMLMSRKDVGDDVDRLITSKNSSRERQSVDKLINDVVCQLKSLETRMANPQVDGEEKLRNAEREIQLIMDLHRKIARIQSMTRSNFQ